MAPSVSVTFCFCMKYIEWEPLNGFAPNSQRRRVWFFGRINLHVKVKGLVLLVLVLVLLLLLFLLYNDDNDT